MGTIKQNYGNQLTVTVTVDHIGTVDKWDVSVLGHSGLHVATGRSRNLDRAIRKALKAAAGKERTFMTVEQYRQQQIDQQIQEGEKMVRELRQQINTLEGHCLEVATDGPREAENLVYSIVEEPAGEITLNIPGRGILHIPADLCPQGRDARADFVKTIMAALVTAPPETLTDVFRKQAGTWGDSIETRLTALQKDFNQHVEDQMDRNMGFEGEDKLLTQALGVFERRSVEADREITAMLAAAERQLISAVNTLEERVAALETKRPTKETPK